MIISCSCGARLKVGDEKLTIAGVKVKCPRCASVHIAKREAAAPAPPAQAAPSPPSAMPWFAASSPAEQREGGLVLIAHDSSVVADMITSVLNKVGIATEYAPNGLEALKKAAELKPQVMIVDVGLTGIYGFELCERLKGDKGTKHVKIVLLSSVYGLTAYKRSPVTLYGADDYIEKHHIPDQLVPKIKKLLFGEQAPAPAPAAPEATPAEPERSPAPFAPLVSRKGLLQEAPTADPQAASGPDRKFAIPEAPSILPTTPVTLGGEAAPGTAAPAPPTQVPERLAGTTSAAAPASRPPEPQHPTAPAASFADGSVRLSADFFEHEEYETPAKPAATAEMADPVEIEKARRFARLIVSDIALYNQEAVDEGIRNGTLFDLLKDDIAEGRTMYESRVPAAVRSMKDYLQEAFDDFIASKKKLH